MPEPLRRLPLFWKIVLANATVVALGGATGAVVVLGMAPADRTAVTGATVLVTLVVLVLSLVVNATLVRVALSPVEGLQRAAEEVRGGALEARSPVSPYADASLGRLVATVNGMLDTLSLHRRRQRELARRVLEAEERERGLIAHELFSGTAQTLAGVLVRLRIAEGEMANGTAVKLGEIRTAVVDALEEIRGVARRLRPPELDELGVRAALEAHARNMTDGSSIEVVFRGELPELDREASLAIFRIVQEAVNNAVLHGQPDTVLIESEVREGRLVVSVADDGVGFDPETSLARTSGSLGLFGMHERAGYVQGELSVESGPGRGTTVRVTLPLQPDDEVGSLGLDEAVERLLDGLVPDAPGSAERAGRPGDTAPATV